MIIYFSGTGNSRLVAQLIATALNDRLHNIEDGSPAALTPGEPLGLIFPTYAWGLPKIFKKFLLTHNLQAEQTWCIMTCGDDMGYADQILEKVLGRTIQASFSVQMPNTYVCLPGFKVDSPELAQHKLRASQIQVDHIATLLADFYTPNTNHNISHRELTRGAMPWLKTYILRPLFNRFLVTDSPFRANQSCTGCGLCVKSCPHQDIVLKNTHPHWKQTECTSCLRCFHHCPQRAIDWGNFTQGKVQSPHPKL